MKAYVLGRSAYPIQRRTASKMGRSAYWKFPRRLLAFQADQAGGRPALRNERTR
jgi:hypothetical protein